MRTAENRLSDKYPVSVVIPCYNAADTLGDCLSALLQNNLRSVELIIVDDASSDATADLIRTFSLSFEGEMRYVRMERRGGPGAARNKGLESARYPYLFFLDADIVLPDSTIHWIRETLDLYSHQPNIAGVLGNYSERIPATDFSTKFKNLYTCYLYRMTDTFSPFIHTPMFVVRKEVLEREGAFDPVMTRAEDFKLGAVLGSKGYRFIIDWRIAGTHLKRYSFWEVLREDWNRIGELKKIRLKPEQRRFSYRAHRWSRILALVLPGMTVLTSVLGLLWPSILWIAGATLLLFFLVNSRLVFYFLRRYGSFFAIRSLGFLFVEMLWAQIALVFAGLRGAAPTEPADR